MRICIDCHARYPTLLERCPDCAFAPPRIQGFLAFAPELAHAGGGFDASFFPVLAGLEQGNFWFRARNQLDTASLAELFAWEEEEFLRRTEGSALGSCSVIVPTRLGMPTWSRRQGTWGFLNVRYRRTHTVGRPAR